MKILIIIMLFLSACSGKTSINGLNMASDKQELSNASKAFTEGDYATAVNLYANLLTNSDNLDHIFTYAESLRLTGQTDEALVQYDKILQSDAAALHALEGKSLCYVAKGKFNKAAQLLSQILKQDATKWRTINALGVIYSLNGHLDESLEYYSLALQVSDKNPAILNNMGLSLAFSGDYDRGQAIIEKSLSYIASNEENKKQQIESNLALVYGVSGQMDAAKQILTKYLSQAQILNNLGFYAQLSEDDDLARTYFSKALAASPVHYKKAWHNLKSIGNKG